MFESWQKNWNFKSIDFLNKMILKYHYDRRHHCCFYSLPKCVATMTSIQPANTDQVSDVPKHEMLIRGLLCEMQRYIRKEYSAQARFLIMDRRFQASVLQFLCTQPSQVTSELITDLAYRKQFRSQIDGWFHASVLHARQVGCEGGGKINTAIYAFRDNCSKFMEQCDQLG